MTRRHSSRGFTLIELLVVIAIIGILSSIVLASLNTARSKGNDAAIKANLATVRVQGELFYDTYGGYVWGGGGSMTSAACPTSPSGGSLFEGDATIRQAVAAAANAAGGAVSAVTRCAIGTGATYAIAVRLSNGTDWWCVDSAGAKKSLTVGSGFPNLGGGGSAPGTCP